MKRAIIMAAALSVLCSVAVLGAGAATAPGSQGILGCAFSKSPVTWPAGQEVVLRFSWRTSTQDQLRDFISASAISITLNGQAVSGTAQYWGTPTLEDGGTWRADWLLPTGIELAKKQALNVVFDDVLRRHVEDGFDPAGQGPGSVSPTGAPLECQITGK